jgi:hypothetical protein
LGVCAAPPLCPPRVACGSVLLHLYRRRGGALPAGGPGARGTIYLGVGPVPVGARAASRAVPKQGSAT